MWWHVHRNQISSFSKSAGASVQSATGSQGLRISGSNVGYTMFQGGVKGTGYPLHSPVSSLPLSCVTICHHISTGVYLSTSHLLDLFWSLITLCVCVIIVTVVCIYLNSPEVLNDKLVTFVIYCTVFWWQNMNIYLVVCLSTLWLTAFLFVAYTILC